MLPKSLEIVYLSGFSLTQSYSTGQILHLTLFLTGIVVVADWLSRKHGKITG